MGRLKEIVFDADHPAALARFWAAVIDGYAIRPYDDEEIARLAGLGFTPETDPTVPVRRSASRSFLAPGTSGTASTSTSASPTGVPRSHGSWRSAQPSRARPTATR
jgi:hypothetical protein